MKKTSLIILFALAALSLEVNAQSGGVDSLLQAAQRANYIAIPNQSAAFIRMPSREASTDADAVYYNPAGTTKLGAGWHLSLNNQSLRYKTKITSDYQYLNNSSEEYEGLVTAPFLPSIYLVYGTKRNFSFSLGLNPIAGAGGAEFKGLPVADRNTADIIPNLQNVVGFTGMSNDYKNLSAYRSDFRSTGLAFVAGTQLNLAYKLNDIFSFAVGVRYVYNRVTATGHTRNIQIYSPNHGGWQSPSDYAYYLQEQSDNPLNAAIWEITADTLSKTLFDREIDVVQKGAGFTPIASVNISPTPKLNLAIKYESRTDIELTTYVKDGKDGGGIYTDGSFARSDLPGFITLGVMYEVLPRFTLASGFRYMFTKNADYNGREELIDKNYYELAFALEYDLNDDINISGGYTFSQWNMPAEYSSDVDFWTQGHTIGFGGKYTFTETLGVNVGVLYTRFAKREYTFTHTPVGTPLPVQVEASQTTNTYEKNNLIFGLGADFALGKKSKEEL